MNLKTTVHVNVDLHFDSDEVANGTELARLAAVCDGLYMLLKAQQGNPTVSQETPRPQIAEQASTVSQETPTPQIVAVADLPTIKPPAARKPATTRSQHTFEEFDQLVRSEMQRLAIDGRMPTTQRWDAERDPRLPKISAVLSRYKIRYANVTGLPELATHLGRAIRAAQCG